MRRHTATVRDRRVSWDDRAVVRGGINSDELALDLDDEWSSCGRVLVFLRPDGAAASTAVEWAGEPVAIPQECMEGAGALRACVVGLADGSRIVTRAEDSPLTVVESGGYEPSEPPRPPRPDLWASLMADVEAATAAAYRSRITAVEAHAAEAASSELVEGEEGAVLVLGLPQGPQGAPGPKGDPGASPSAKVEQTATGATVTVTDAGGTTVAELTNGRDGVAPRAGAGISVAGDGTVSVDPDGLRGMAGYTRTAASQPTEHSTGSVQFFVAGDLAVALPRETVSVAVPEGWQIGKLPFAVLRTGKPLSNPMRDVRLAQLVTDQGWFYVDMDADEAGDVTLSLFVPSAKAGQTIAIKSSGFTQLVIPLAGGGSLVENLWLRTAEGVDKGVEFTILEDGAIRMRGAKTGGFPRVYSRLAPVGEAGIVPGRAHSLTCEGASGSAYVAVQFNRAGGTSLTHVCTGKAVTFDVPDDAVSVMCFPSGSGPDDPQQSVDATLRPMLCEGAPAGYVPYGLGGGAGPR